MNPVGGSLTPEERQEAGLGLAASLVVHAVLIGAAMLAYRGEPAGQDLIEEFVTFMVPPDRAPGLPAAEPVPYGREGGGSREASPSEGAAVPGGEGPLAAPAGDTVAAEQSLPAAEMLGDTVLTELEVDSVVQRYEWSGAPQYPPSLLARNIEGSASVLYIVDTTGFADSLSLRIISATHRDFGEAVREALPTMRFRPALLGGQKVRQMVQQTFTFKIRRPADSVPPPLVTDSFPHPMVSAKAPDATD